jgi:predicted xylose isomerase-like sugar epimerase
MSRALNLNATQADVRAEADKRGARITSIEPLYPSGTRVVFANGDAAAAIARAFKSRVVHGPVVRTPLRTKRAH